MKKFELKIDTSISELIDLQKYIQLNNLIGIKVTLKEHPTKEKNAMSGNDIVNVLVFIIGSKATEMVLEELFYVIKDFFKNRYKTNRPNITIQTKSSKEYNIENDGELKKVIKHLGEL